MEDKKRLVLFLIAFAVFCIFNCFSAYAVGVGPALTRINFQPNLEFSVDYIVVGVGGDQELEIYSRGDLKDYVSFDKTNLTGEGNFKTTIKLPPHIEKPGPNPIYIGVIEALPEGGGMGARVGVEAVILINVPYPGKYAEVSVSVGNINEGEDLEFRVNVNNLGLENIDALTNVEVYSGEEKIETVDLGQKYIETQKEWEFMKKHNSSDYKPGPYKAIAVVNYGKITKAETEFKIGSLFVNITNWTTEVIEGKINPFEIEIESLWNTPISNIYADVNITDKTNNGSVDFFKTPSVSLNPWQKTTLQGYLNAEKIKTGAYEANVTLFYEDATTGKIIEINVINPRKALIIKLAIGSIIGIAVLIIIYLVWRRYGKIIKKRKGKR